VEPGRVDPRPSRVHDPGGLMAVVNICFHGVGVPQRELEPGEDQYWIGRDEFLRILDDLAGRPAVRLSFDDGNASDVEIGLPALVDRGLTATFFVLAGRLDAAGSLSSDAVRGLRDAGMQVGTHGWDHRPWRGMDDTTSTKELEEARSRIAAVVDRPVEEAACPLGRYDRALLARMRHLGYTRVYTSDRRPARPRDWVQPRFSVGQSDTVASVRRTMITPPPPAQRLRLEAVGALKRLR
jgi:peptidoglycan/xylan/chitin deacetylase (PgdA/CDA1 family)